MDHELQKLLDLCFELHVVFHKGSLLVKLKNSSYFEGVGVEFLKSVQ